MSKKEVKMTENENYSRIIGDIDKTIQNYLDVAKEQNLKLSRNDIIEMVTTRLEELLKMNSDSKERTWVVSGIAIGIAIVLRIDEKLKMVG